MQCISPQSAVLCFLNEEDSENRPQQNLVLNYQRKCNFLILRFILFDNLTNFINDVMVLLSTVTVVRTRVIFGQFTFLKLCP